MKRKILAVLVPPFAVCRYGCAGYCAAPIGLFWLAGIGSLIYGFYGGPLGVEGISWTTLILGVVMWIIAAVWAEDTIKGVDEGDLQATSNLCRVVKKPAIDEHDPFEDIKKAG
ncbi:MAG: hypothetical protein HUJ29_08785 [Gammaproteobacteria bacterium]|nr:hypothetical protein [Gammaproteobacteria bacterium]